MSTVPTLPAGLYALVDDGVRPERAIPEKAEAVVAGGARVLQLRLKRSSVRDAVALACEVIRRVGERSLVLVNDRVDVALVAGAHGVHVGDEDMLPEDARAVLGPSKIVGVTVRSAAAARDAQRAGASYCGIGPVFATSTKIVNAPVLGLEALARAVRESPLPLVAIAGITLENIAEVARTGARGAAVLSDLLCAPDVTRRARELAAAFDSGATRRTVEGGA